MRSALPTFIEGMTSRLYLWHVTDERNTLFLVT